MKTQVNVVCPLHFDEDDLWILNEQHMEKRS